MIYVIVHLIFDFISLMCSFGGYGNGEDRPEQRMNPIGITQVMEGKIFFTWVFLFRKVYMPSGCVR